MVTTTTVEHIARVCYEVINIHKEIKGSTKVLSWKDCSDKCRQKAINNVLLHLCNPFIELETVHKNWMKIKITNGWRYGPIKNTKTKEHPFLISYKELPKEQKQKYRIYKVLTREMYKVFCN